MIRRLSQKDPAKLAQVAIKLANSPTPPVHLPVGKDAIAYYWSKAATMEEEVNAWESISASTDRETQPVF